MLFIYLGIIIIILFFACSNSEDVQYHAKENFAVFFWFIFVMNQFQHNLILNIHYKWNLA